VPKHLGKNAALDRNATYNENVIINETFSKFFAEIQQY